MLRPVYLDTNAVITLVELKEPGVLSFLLRVNRARRRLVSSEITIAELLVRPLRDRQDDLIAAYEKLFAEDNGIVSASPMTRETMRRSADIRAKFGGHLVDSIHVATAQMLDCEVIISSDKRLRLPDGLIRIPIADLKDVEIGAS